jgi:hypothetical protein
MALSLVAKKAKPQATSNRAERSLSLHSWCGSGIGSRDPVSGMAGVDILFQVVVKGENIDCPVTSHNTRFQLHPTNSQL